MTDQKRFLFLQGPHGPFFYALRNSLRAAGAEVWRVGFSQGDRAFWPHRASYIPFVGGLDTWPETLTAILDEKNITDIALYGDIRPLHAKAVDIAKAKGLTVHVFEEGYLRPYWISYERGGSNGHSRLMELTVSQMEDALGGPGPEITATPANWGDLRQHIFYGAAYHFFVLLFNRRYKAYRPHRNISVAREFALYLRKLLFLPITSLERWIAQQRIFRGGFPYHLVMLQLEHDSSFQAHSPFDTLKDFLSEVIAGFAEGAPQHHHLVIKAHPLEDGRSPLRADVRRLACKHKVLDRVHFVRGGKLARLLEKASSAITINSTAGQQALWRGMPLKIFGTAVYDKPEFVSDQNITTFFETPRKPDARAYRSYRSFLTETSQVPGGYYAAAARRIALRRVPDLMLAGHDPYDPLLTAIVKDT